MLRGSVSAVCGILNKTKLLTLHSSCFKNRCLPSRSNIELTLARRYKSKVLYLTITKKYLLAQIEINLVEIEANVWFSSKEFTHTYSKNNKRN